MKKILSVIGAAALLASCNNAPTDSFIIEGKVTGLEDGTKVILKKQGEMDYIDVDSTEVKNGIFEIKGKADEVSISLLSFGGEQMIVPFVLENGKISITFDSSKLDEAKASGTPNNEDFYTFNQESGKIQKKIMEFQQNSGQLFSNARETNDTKVMDSLMGINENMMKELEGYSVDFVKKNKSSFISMLILNQMTQGNSLETSEAMEIFKGMDAKVKETKAGKELKEFLDKNAKVAIGSKAPDFSGPSPEGKTISLKESLGKVTIIDFWASWCGPCRVENPNVVRIYNKYHDKGLNIIGVSLDKDGDKWKEAIEKDNLTWAHISNLLFWQDPIAADYSVRAIPATFILDENGIIVAKDLRGDELEKKIEELLSK